MNDVRELCELALDVPAPPMPDAAEAFAVARRSARRRHGIVMAGFGLAGTATMAAVTALALVTPVASGRPAPSTVAVAASSTSDPVPVPTLSLTAPTEKAAKAHGRVITTILIDATPAAFTAVSQRYGSAVDNTWVVLPAYRSGYGSLTSVLVSSGHGQGTLETFIYADGLPAPTGSLCSADVTAEMVARINDPSSENCETITVNGVAIRVTTEQDKDLGEVKIATRFLQGGMLQVIAQQGTADYQNDGALPPDAPRQTRHALTKHEPPLAVQPFTSEVLATIAADPSVLP